MVQGRFLNSLLLVDKCYEGMYTNIVSISKSLLHERKGGWASKTGINHFPILKYI